jgi:hypothetical protein
MIDIENQMELDWPQLPLDIADVVYFETGEAEPDPQEIINDVSRRIISSR